MTVQYTREWRRIAGSHRPIFHVAITFTVAFLLGLVALLVTGNFIWALVGAAAGLVLAAGANILLWFSNDGTEINLGERLIRSRHHVHEFGEIESVHPRLGNLWVEFTDEQTLPVPVVWLGHGDLTLVDRMLRLTGEQRGAHFVEARAYMAELLQTH